MASKASAVIVKFLGNTRALDKSVRGAEKKLTGLQKFSRGANIALAAGVAAAGTLIAGSVRNFSNAQASIASATGRTGDELAALTEQWRNAYTDTTATAEGMAAAVGNIDTMFDGSAEQVGSLAEEAGKYVQIAGGNLETVTEQLGRVAEAYGRSIDETEGSLDLFTRLSADYAVDADTLMGQLLKHGDTLRTFGLNMDQSAVALAKLNDAGVKIRTWDSALDTAAGKFVAMGKDPEQGMRDLEKAVLDADSKMEAICLAAEVVGSTLAGPFVDNIQATGGIISKDFTDEVIAADGAINDMYDSSLTMEQRMEDVRKKFEDIGLKIAEALLPKLEAIFGWLSEDGNIQKALVAIGVLFGVTLVGKVALFTTKLKAASATIAAANAAVTGTGTATAITGAGAGTILGGLGLVVAALAAIAGTLIVLHFVKEWLPDRFSTPDSPYGDFGEAYGDRDDTTPGAARIKYLTDRGFIPEGPTGIPRNLSALIGGEETVPTGEPRRAHRSGAGGAFMPTEQPPTGPQGPQSGFEGSRRTPRPAPTGSPGQPGQFGGYTQTPGQGDPFGRPFGMAEGGIVRRPTLAMIGEAGPEAVIPLDRAMPPGTVVNITVEGSVISENELLERVEERLNHNIRTNGAGRYNWQKRPR